MRATTETNALGRTSSVSLGASTGSASGDDYRPTLDGHGCTAKLHMVERRVELRDTAREITTTCVKTVGIALMLALTVGVWCIGLDQLLTWILT